MPVPDSKPHLSHPKYRPDIDGLRAVAVIAVVAFHAFPSWIKGGFVGVDVFFVISGYLISTILFENLDQNTFSFSEFYSRRIRRIFPALILVLVACLSIGWFALLGDELRQLGKYVAAGAGFVSNLALWSDAGYFDSSAETKPLLHLWSLGIEEQFYIVWPLFLWFAWKRKFNLLKATIAIAVISFALNLWDVRQDPTATFYSPQTRFWELLSGSLLAWLIIYSKGLFDSVALKVNDWLTTLACRKRSESGKLTLANLLSATGAGLLAIGFWRINKDSVFPGWWALMPVLGSVLLIAAGPKAWLNRHVLSSKVAVWFGLISFPLYLWHWPLLSFARIIKSNAPNTETIMAAVLTSIALAWLTTKFVEKPFRLGTAGARFKVAILCVSMAMVGCLGFAVSQSDFAQSHGYENLTIKRKGFEHAFGHSLAWYQGKENWLFLGNDQNEIVAKLKLSKTPTEDEINATTQVFSGIAKAGTLTNTKIVLIVAPNKSSIYPEYLPDGLTPSPKKYSSYFLDRLDTIQNLTVYNPTNDFLQLKSAEGLLYWKTDSHWNNKGAFLGYSGVMKSLGLPIPQVAFQPGAPYAGDIINISKLENFPLHPEDNWNVIWREQPVWKSVEIPNEKKTSFATAEIVTNNHPLSNKYVWVVGDSFAGPLRQYFNATFKEVRYIGHWEDKLNGLAMALEEADRKPDYVFIVKVERSF